MSALAQPALSARRSWTLSALLGLFLLSATPAFCASSQGLGQFPLAFTDYCEGWGISADGSTVTGWGVDSLNLHTAYIRSGGPLTPLPVLGPGGESYGWTISGDATTIVGQYDSGVSFPEAFLWTSGGGMVSLGNLPSGGGDDRAQVVDATGDVVVGYATNAAADHEAFIWTTVSGTMTGLGTLEGFGQSEAWAVSSDGNVVVGESDVTGGIEAFRWTVGTGMVGLGDLSGGTLASVATAVNADGSTIVGFSNSDAGNEAFLWTQSEGMVSLADYLRLKGVSLTGWTLDTATGVSADGTTIVGCATTPDGGSEAFVARTTGGFTTLDSLADSLGAMAGLGARLSGMGLSRIQSLLLASRGALSSGTPGLSGGDGPQARRRYWVVGSLFTDSALSGSDLGGDGGTGLSWTWDSGLSAGAGLFAAKRFTKTGWGRGAGPDHDRAGGIRGLRPRARRPARRGRGRHEPGGPGSAARLRQRLGRGRLHGPDPGPGLFPGGPPGLAHVPGRAPGPGALCHALLDSGGPGRVHR